MLLFHKHIAAVSASLFTWEVTTAFDGVLTETELQKRFAEELEGAMESQENRVFFWHLVSFNASDGRKHRYFVALANESLLRFRKTFDRCLPKQVSLYALADRLLRGEDFEGADGNLMLVALWDRVLYIVVFAKGRLCHWSEECGYGETFDECCEQRISQFKVFLKTDELFANEGDFHEERVCCDNLNMDEMFCAGACDPFWRQLDLDACSSMKPCEKRRWTLFAMMVFCLCVLLVAVRENPLSWNVFGKDAILLDDVAAVALDLPPDETLECLMWAKGHGLMRFEKRAHLPSRHNAGCELPPFQLLGIVGGRAALVQLADGESKTLVRGDVLFSYRVKSIGKNDIVLRCGTKEVRYEVGVR